MPHSILNRILVVAAAAIGLSSCERTYRGDQLSANETTRIKALAQLSEDEQIYQFYSNNDGVEGAGNYCTTKRIGHYWRGQRAYEIESAYYQDIARITPYYNPPGDFVVPYLLVTRKDSTQFKVFVGGEHRQVKDFFVKCLTHWRVGH
ncbi:hypothetical protein [Hymenobacter sp. 102]|uniref:hypothetical protein n=1 Tax=Hymenobacter sp. 102 TaxID=3403152 RepID=UPI003CEF62E6